MVNRLSWTDGDPGSSGYRLLSVVASDARLYVLLSGPGFGEDGDAEHPEITLRSRRTHEVLRGTDVMMGGSQHDSVSVGRWPLRPALTSVSVDLVVTQGDVVVLTARLDLP